jgi:RNA polymerase sigma factor (sigma-70 family)
MTGMNDMELLREFSEKNSESAFAEIASRHIDLVYSVAFRFTHNSQDAQDIAQAVFIILSRKASQIGPNTILTGWLYETTRFTAMNFLTGKTRREAREKEASMQSLTNDLSSEDAWQQLAPILEEGMTRLNEKERTLMALHFFENRSNADTAALLGIQEWAARKRTSRAIEKLRFFLPNAVLRCPPKS